MASLPLYDPGGTQRTEAQRANNASPDAFGAAPARALAQLGQQTAGLGETLTRLDEEQKALDDATAVVDAAAEASNRQRQALYGEGGIFTRTGKNSEGMTDTALLTMEEIGNDVGKRFTNPKQAATFHRLWSGQTQSTADAAAKVELQQKTAYRTATKTAALSSLTDDAVAAYNDEEVLAEKIGLARETIRTNPDGLPDNMVAQMERESVSAMQVQVIQRMAQDNPGRALDYYERHKGDVSGADHAKVNAMISGVSKMREAGQYVDEIAGGGKAGEIMRSLINAESRGDPAAVSEVGAGGLTQLMPDTAREEASALPGVGARIAGMSDEQLLAYWATPQGQKDNIRIGTSYLNKQLKKFNGDLEASLIAYNAGPDNAVKWLNAGRDYSALPMPEQTQPYVKKVFASLGYTVGGNTSADVQAATKGGNYFKGDADAFLATKLAAGKPASYITDMKPALKNRLAGLINDAPDFVKAGLGIQSGARSVDKQAQLWADAVKKYGSEEAARKWVAPPGKSKHNHGDAADLGWNGSLLSSAPAEVVKWVHDNAGKYGLTFPLGNENWHIETIEARKGGSAKGDRTLDPASRRVQQAFDNQGDTVVVARDGFGTVTLAPDTANPADIYTKNTTPFTVPPDASNLNDWLATARENLADNPSMLAEVERQLTDKAAMSTSALKAQGEQIKTELFRTIVNGGSIKDLDPLQLAQHPEAVKTMLEFESAWNREKDDSDPAVYYKLSQMNGAELHKLGPNIVDYAKDLSKADLKGFIDKAGEFAKNGSVAKRATDQTRTQIITSAENILGMKPNETPAHAVRMAALNRALDTKIGAFIETNGKEPDGVAMQAMMDELLLEGHVKKTGFDPAMRAFELTPEDRNNFYVAETIAEVPEAARPVVAKGAATIWNVPAGKGVPEQMAVSFYNDYKVVQLGGAPTPPEGVTPRIRQGLLQALKRVPTEDEVSAFYRQWIIKATEQEK